MRPMHDALLATNEELFTLSTKAHEFNSTSINLDPNTRDRIIIRPSAKSYVLRCKAAAAQVGENRDKLACFTSVADALSAIPTTTTTPERVPQAIRALSTQESARRRRRESRVENTPPSLMARAINKADAVVAAQKKRVVEGRIEKRKTSPRFRPILRPTLQAIAPPVVPQPASSPLPAKSEPGVPSCVCHEGFECRVCRVRKLTQSFTSIISVQCEIWKASSMLPVAAA